MRRSLLSLAAFSSFAISGAAMAQSTVTLYGLLDVSTGVEQANGATTGVNQHSRGFVNSNDSYVGVRGTEDLGGGLKAIFQVESGVSVNGNADSSLLGNHSSKGSYDTFGARNSFVGLQSDQYGTVRLGNYDSPYKRSTMSLDPADDHGPTTITGILGNNPFNPYGYNNGSFNRRLKDSVSYDTPNFAGFTLSGAWGAGNSDDTSIPGANDRVYSVAGTYATGPILATVAYERHSDAGFNFGSFSSSSDEGLKGALGYTFGPAKVGVIAEELDFKGDADIAGGPTKYKRLAYGVTGNYDFMPRNSLNASYIHANRGSSNNGFDTSGLQADQVSLGYDYSLSKRTQAYAYYTRIMNRGNAAYDFGNNPVGAAPGADPQSYGVGLRHAF